MINYLGLNEKEQAIYDFAYTKGRREGVMLVWGYIDSQLRLIVDKYKRFASAKNDELRDELRESIMHYDRLTNQDYQIPTREED